MQQLANGCSMLENFNCRLFSYVLLDQNTHKRTMVSSDVAEVNIDAARLI